ncbi:hypothetical protein B0T25DRAFT_552117 [Lasiosphaeria hispida]|uniref:Fungal N-terminal domain-containing protein n=1 Tax=Lasiosphaeria hispida TaxID=260671 RepID=A0AAJ0HBW8_9PEZI|nr:hypothetical protein B0T25DRAFT_552117 [Lasiosphaeria hispida]
MEVVGIVSSLLAFTSSAVVIAQVITRGGANTKSLTEELEVIGLILEECIQTLESPSHAEKSDIPPSIGRCLVLCVKKRNDAIETMEKIYGKQGDKRSAFVKGVRYTFLAVAYEQPLIARFNSFRDAVMLLRDLTSDFRIESRIMQLSSAMTILLNEDTQFQLNEDVASIVSIDEMNAEEHPPDASHHRDATARPPRPRRRVDANKFLFEFISMQRFDFKRQIFVLIELPGIKGADMYEHIPVRNIVDFGSNEENFISRKILTDYGMDPAKIRQLSADEQTERTHTTIAGPFTPTHEVTLYWHRLKDTNQRRARFLVVDNNGFDVIIGNKLWSATEGPNHAHLAMPGYQSWKERKKTKKAEEKKVREAWATIQRQKEEAIRGSSGASSSTGAT